MSDAYDSVFVLSLLVYINDHCPLMSRFTIQPRANKAPVTFDRN